MATKKPKEEAAVTDTETPPPVQIIFTTGFAGADFTIKPGVTYCVDDLPLSTSEIEVLINAGSAKLV